VILYPKTGKTMKSIVMIVLVTVLYAPSSYALKYTVTAKGGWGEGIIDSKYTLDNEGEFADEGYIFTGGAGLVFESNILTGCEFSYFDSSRNLGVDDRIEIAEAKIHLGYRFNLARHFRLVPIVGVSRWKLESKEGNFKFTRELSDVGIQRGYDRFLQFNIEFPINDFIAVVSSINHMNFDYGVLKYAQAGVTFQF
jgi:hypothetical protein